MIKTIFGFYLLALFMITTGSLCASWAAFEIYNIIKPSYELPTLTFKLFYTVFFLYSIFLVKDGLSDDSVDGEEEFVSSAIKIISYYLSPFFAWLVIYLIY
jgi:hypothetical protein